MARRRAATVAFAALAVWSAGSASGQIVAIFSNIAGQANNNVPTIGGNFQTGTTSTIAFDRPYVSPDGSRWILGAFQEAGTDDKEIFIVGSGPTNAGATTVVVEDSATVFDGALLWESFDTRASINNAGQWVVSGNVTGDTLKDELIVKFDGVTQVPAIREADGSPIAGENFGTTIDSANILANGDVAYRSVLAPTTTKQIAAIGATVVGNTDVTVPTGQLVAPDQSIDVITADRFATSFDGQHYIMRGDLNGATTTDDFVLYDGRVVIQEGANLPGGVLAGTNVGIISGDAGSNQISHNGLHWLARTAMADGSGATATDVVLHNGNLLAKTGDPIVPASTELWDDTIFTTTFFLNVTDNNGNRVVGGTTNNADINKDAVLVYYGANGSVFELVREGDPVDLDGNGLFDDNTFIDVFGNDDAFLTDSGRYYFVAALQDANGTALGNAFLTMVVPEPTTGLALAALAGVAVTRRRR
jgi:hypothetical protein